MADDPGRPGSAGWFDAGRIRWLTPFRATALYIVVGTVWIALSDSVAGALVGDVQAHQRLHVALSWLFVVATAVSTLALVRRSLGAVEYSQRLLRSTIQSMAVPLLLLDRHGNVVDANRAAMEMFGVSRREELIMHVHEVGERFDLRYLDGRRVPFARYASDAALNGEVIRSYEAIIRRADGSDLYIAVSAAPVREFSGAPVQMAVTVLHDIDEHKRLEKMRDDFLSVAAHELKTPVATVKGYARLMQHESFPKQDSARVLEVITRQCDRMERMVRELLELSRVKGGRVHLNFEPHDLTLLAADAVERMQLLARDHRLVLDAQGEALTVVDRERIDQVITNLLDNAMKFSPEGGEVRVRVRPEQAEVVLSVTDHGVGIPRDKQRRIFERFFQAHVGQLRNPGGMGVGLHLAREILALHGGRIWFESEPGAGTTFFLAVPRANAGPARAPAPT